MRRTRLTASHRVAPRRTRRCDRRRAREYQASGRCCGRTRRYGYGRSPPAATGMNGTTGTTGATGRTGKTGRRSHLAEVRRDRIVSANRGFQEAHTAFEIPSSVMKSSFGHPHLRCGLAEGRVLRPATAACGLAGGQAMTLSLTGGRRTGVRRTGVRRTGGRRTGPALTSAF